MHGTCCSPASFPSARGSVRVSQRGGAPAARLTAAANICQPFFWNLSLFRKVAKVHTEIRKAKFPIRRIGWAGAEPKAKQSDKHVKPENFWKEAGRFASPDQDDPNDESAVRARRVISVAYGVGSEQFCHTARQLTSHQQKNYENAKRCLAVARQPGRCVVHFRRA